MNAWSPNPEIREDLKSTVEADPLWGVEAEEEYKSDMDTYIV
jgi:hypothetical protein